MKIGLIRRGYSSTGGAERYLLRFAEGLEKAGHEVVLFSDRRWPEEVWPSERRETILVEAVPEPRELPEDNKAKAVALQFLDQVDQKTAKLRQTPLRFADELQKIDPRQHCDFLFSLERVWDCDCYRAGDGVHRAWLKRRAKYEAAPKSFLRYFAAKHQALLSLELETYGPAAKPHIIANSRMVSQEIRDIYHTEPDRITVIPNGYDRPESKLEVSRSEERQKLGLRPEETVFLFVGSGWGRKGLRFAEYAVRRIHQLEGTQNPVRLLVAGKDKRALKAMRNSGPITYLGPVTTEELSGIYSAADAFVLPTIYDPFSNATLEAAAHGLPIITTDANGFSEHIPPFEGSIVKNPDSGELVTAFRQWMTNPERRHKAGEKNREVARDFSIAKNVDATLSLFLRLISGR